MENKNVRYRAAVCRWAVAAALCCLSLSALAQPIAAPSAFDQFMERATGGGKQSVNFGRDGTPVASPGVPTVNTDGGMPRVDATGSIRNPSGNPVPVNTTARVPGAEIGRAVGRAAANIGIKLAVVVGVGLTLYDLAKEIGFILGRNPDGSLKYEKLDPAVCTVAPCYVYSGNNQLAYIGTTVYPTAAALCNAYLAAFDANSPSSAVLDTCEDDADPRLRLYITPQAGAGAPYLDSFRSFSRVLVAPEPAQYLPSSREQFEDAVAAKSGWPAGSAVRRLLAEDAPAAGEKVQTGPHTVTGPATSPGAQRVTQNPTNNTTKTETTTHHHTYSGNTVTTTNVTVTNITNNTTGDTVSSETTTETPAPEKDPEDACKANPERVGCLDIDTPEGEIPKTTKDVTFTPENLGLGGGSCPANITSSINGQTVTVFSYVKPCQIITSYVAPLVLAISAFVAFMILMPGGRPE